MVESKKRHTNQQILAGNKYVSAPKKLEYLLILKLVDTLLIGFV